MSGLYNYLALRVRADQELFEAQARSVAALIESWDRELERDYRALIEAQRKRQELAAQDAVISANVANFIRGLLAQAQTGDDITCSLPSSLGAGEVLGDNSPSELAAMLAHVDVADDEVLFSQRLAADALAHGRIPHPVHLASICDALAGIAARRGDDTNAGALDAWRALFADQGGRLDGLVATQFRNPRLQAINGAERLSIARETVKSLEGFQPSRTFRLIADPTSLLEDPKKIAAPQGTSPLAIGRVARADLGRVLDNLPFVRR